MPAKLEESKISYLHSNIQIIKAGDDMQLAGWLRVGLGEGHSHTWHLIGQKLVKCKSNELIVDSHQSLEQYDHIGLNPGCQPFRLNKMSVLIKLS